MKVGCSRTGIISALCSADKLGHTTAWNGYLMWRMTIWMLLTAVAVCLIFATYYTVWDNQNAVTSFHVHFKDPIPISTEPIKISRDPVKIAFAKHFQDHMVLQQAPARANIYGFSPNIGQQVFLQITPSVEPFVYKTTVKEGPEPGVGTWSFTLDPVRGNTSFSIKVTSQGVALSLSDVLFGDVWLCSGQSNMEFPVKQMSGAAEELRDPGNYPQLRLMTVGKAESPTPLYDLRGVRQSWTGPSNGSLCRDFSAVCWLYGKAIHKALGYPIGLVATSYEGTPVQVWSSPEVLAKCGVNTSIQTTAKERLLSGEFFQFGPSNFPAESSVLWNAMVYPLLGMTIKGAIWYQGESDASGSRLTHYNCTFPSMIQDWRQNFHKASNGQTDPNFPFGFVQLAGYRPNATTTRGFPGIRWHQTADHGYVPNIDLFNVFMAVAMDLPDFKSAYGKIHPQEKRDVAARLALGGLSVAYGRDLVYQGPFPERLILTSDGVVVSYGNRWNLTVRSSNGFEDTIIISIGGHVSLTHMITRNTDQLSALVLPHSRVQAIQLMCVSDTRQEWGETQIVTNNQTSVTLGLTCGLGQEVDAVRYAWQETPCDFKQCAIYETINELPGPPFALNLSQVTKINI